jgi:hypothetical protein
MLELLILLGIFSPFLLMVWLTWARRRAQAAERAQLEIEAPPFSEEGFTEVLSTQDGLSFGRSYDGDGAVIPPYDQSGEIGGIKALQGRR